MFPRNFKKCFQNTSFINREINVQQYFKGHSNQFIARWYSNKLQTTQKRYGFFSQCSQLDLIKKDIRTLLPLSSASCLIHNSTICKKKAIPTNNDVSNNRCSTTTIKFYNFL